MISKAARAIGAPILVGAILDGPGDHVRNAGIVWGPRSGPGQMYVKRHPVPFGEYIPWRSVARKVTKKVDLVPHDMAAGDTVGVLNMGGLRLGDVICFEIAYDGLVRSTVKDGAQIIATQTNNATFGKSSESPQQVAMARLRAVEHNRANLVASTSGISAVIAPDGKLLKKSEIFTAAAFDGPVPIQSGETLATRIGAIPEWIFTVVGAGTVLFVGGAALWERYPIRRKGKGKDGSGTDGDSDGDKTDGAGQLQKENA
jgi:apolipoprotein N-acyltransferase